ncbi:DMT family transporter [Horticoccus luteus]|uniref:DMT family transporter n=1 Tax=Horticoccus luteus TaxID=2862869 RepID=A0A8F9TVL2_9BACT|nr:DMT family transporter [Horticoccus luteus]QYM78935.1 DMT family transporter [Horticoccus luteus]
MTATASLHRSRALLMLLCANFFWGLSFPVIKGVVLVQERLVPLAGSWFYTVNVVAPRFLLGVILILLFRPRTFFHSTRAEWTQGVVIGLFSAAGMLFQNDGLQFTAASTSAFLTQLYAILIPIYVALRSRRAPGPVVWLSCGLVLAGVAILGRFDWRAAHLGRGEWETLLASVFFMGQILWLEKPAFAANRALNLTLIMFATQAVVFGGLTLLTMPDWAALGTMWTSPAWVALILILTVFCTVVAYWLMNAWQPKISATEAGLIYCVEPIFGSAMALFVPGLISAAAAIAYANESLTMNLLVGGGLITAANVLIQLRPPLRHA